MIINASVSSATSVGLNVGAFGLSGLNSGVSLNALVVSMGSGVFTLTGQQASVSLGASATIDSFTALHTGLLVAPAQIKLRAVPGAGFTMPGAPAGTDYDPPRHVITYISTVRGSPLSAPSHAPTNLLTAWKDPNVAYGQEPTFVFDTAGTYDIDMWAVDEVGAWGEATYQVVVQDPDTYYAGALTICYSETDFTGKPTGATEVGSLSALNSALTAQAGNDVRIMFRGGEHFDFGTYISSGGVANWSITSFGTGGHASLQLQRYFSDTSNDVVAKPPTSGGEQKYHDIDLLGDWDASKENGADGQSPFWHQDIRDTLMHRCTVSGHNAIFTPAKPADATTILFTFSDCYITNWSNFGIFSYSYDQAGNRYYSVLDCAIHQNVDAAGGLLSDRSLSNAHGPWRLEDADNVYCARTSFYSRNGWSAGIPTAAQPCLRWNSDPGAGTVGYFERCVFQGGIRCIDLTPQDSGGGTPESTDTATNLVLDKIITIGTADTEYHIWCRYGGVTVRNWLAYEPNIPKRGYGLQNAIFTLHSDDPSPVQANLDTPVRVHSATLISLLSTANNRYTSTEAGNENVEDFEHNTTTGTFTDFTTENYIWHAPNQNAAVNASPAPDLVTASGVTFTHKGKKNSLGIYDSTLGSTIADSAVLSIPYSAFNDKDGTPTNQAYWQSLANPGSLRHAIIVAGVQGKMFSYLGDFSVSFANATNMEITNTSGQSWNSGSRIRMKPDHSEFQAAMDATFSSDGLAVPLARPVSADNWSTGRIAQDDLTIAARAGSDIPGAPAGTQTRGALEYIATAPQFASASVNAAGTEVYVNVSGGPISGTWATTGFTVRLNGHRLSLASASEVSDTITLVVDDAGPIIDVETVTVSYDGSGDWANGGTPLASFVDQSVTNNSTVSADTTFTTDVTLTNQDYTGTSGVDAIVDSYAGTWQSSYEASGSDYQYPIQFRDRGTAKTTVIGLTSYGHASLTLDWEYTYNTQTPRDNTNNIGAKDNHDLTIFRACYVDYGWDAFRVNSSSGNDTFIIEGCYVNIDRDDFLEADDNCSGTIRDCLFDGGFAGISFTDDINSSAGKQIDCVGVLSRLTPYLYNGVTTHFGPAVKLSPTSMDWSANNCIFAVEKPDHRTDYVQRGWDHLTGGGTGNFLLNLSDTAFAGGYPLPPAGWTVLQGATARAKWETEKAAWLAAHGYTYLISAVTDTDGDQVTLTFSGNVSGTADTTDWALRGVTGAPVAPTGVTISTNTVVLDFAASTIDNGDTVTLDYYGGDVSDGDGIQIGYMTKYAVTNNVP